MLKANLKVLIVTENASLMFGGEAALPVHYFRVLRRRGIDAWLLAHVRTADELRAMLPDERERMIFVPDTALHKALFRAGRILPARIASFTTGFAIRMITFMLQKRIIRNLVESQGISVIHQPAPVSPREPSFLHGFGVPVVIGPMNGGIDYPSAFRRMERWPERLALTLGRLGATVANRLVPGKRKAAVLLVANERTRRALPQGSCPNVLELVENGVDLSVWRPGSSRPRSGQAPTRFVFVGRLVDWKAVDLLLHAFKSSLQGAPSTLTIIGDGPERAALEALAADLGLSLAPDAVAGSVRFCGWLPQADCARLMAQFDALILPSLMECGGAVVLEAMASGLPVIATDWGGPADYLDASCGVLVPPSSRENLIRGLACAMAALAHDPQRRVALGAAGQRKVLERYDWERKVDSMLSIYHGALAQRDGGP